MSNEHIKKFDLLVESNDNEPQLAANDNRTDKSIIGSEGELIRRGAKAWDSAPENPQKPEKTA